jgi:YD repeat-containing protein
VRTNRTIGMSQVQFGELLRRVEGLVTWDKGAGRPRGLTLAQGLKATLMYFKNNITEEVIAELLFVSQSVISETISTLEGVIVEALKDFEPDLAEAAEGLAGRVAVIDGSLHPCWSWKDKKDLWSGKHKETGHQHQYVCDLAGNLRYISDPLPGKTHDAKAFRDLQLDHHFNESNAFADRDMSGAASPHRSRSQPTASCSNGIRSSTRWSTSIDMSSSEQSPTSRHGAACTQTTAAHFEPTRPPSVRFAHFTSSS